MTAAAIRELIDRLNPLERELLEKDRWRDIEVFSTQHGFASCDVRSVLKEIRQDDAAKNWRFTWLRSVTRLYGGGEIKPGALAVANVLFAFSNSTSRYVWPSQQTIAQGCGWSPSNRDGVIRGLNQLEAIGIIRRVAARDCPPHVARLILADKSEGGSGRDIRAMAYALVSVDEWRIGNRSLNQLPNNVAKPATLNHEVKPLPASQEDSSHFGDSSSAFRLVDTSTYGNEGEHSHG